jgi:hypothetical protein
MNHPIHDGQLACCKNWVLNSAFFNVKDFTMDNVMALKNDV